MRPSDIEEDEEGAFALLLKLIHIKSIFPSTHVPWRPFCFSQIHIVTTVRDSWGDTRLKRYKRDQADHETVKIAWELEKIEVLCSEQFSCLHVFWKQIVFGKDFCFTGIFILLSISAVDMGRIANRGQKDS